MIGNYTDYIAESQGGWRRKVEKSFGRARPRGAPAPHQPETKPLAINLDKSGIWNLCQQNRN
jgi:hypothetical protein